MATVQLRRYRIAPQQLAEFVSWFRRAAPTRQPFGFVVEFAYVNREAGEFVWAVSHPGDAEEFAAAEERWRASPERTAVFAEMPDCVKDHDVSIVEPVLAS